MLLNFFLTQANIKKLEFSVKYIKYLGFIISIDGIKARPRKDGYN